MDFKEISDIWNDSSASGRELSEAQVEQLLMLRKKSNISVHKLQRNYRRSLFAGLAMYLLIACIILLFTEPRNILILLPMVTALMLVPLYLGYRFYASLGSFQVAEMNFSQVLDTTIPQMERYVKFGAGKIYKYMLIPLALITGIVIGILAATGGSPLIETIRSMETGSLVKIVAVIILGSAITIPISQKMMGRLFVRHLEELKECKEELSNIDNT